MKDFMSLLYNLQQLRNSKSLLGTLSPLTVDHMNREECYYLSKLSQVSVVKRPNCDPAKLNSYHKLIASRGLLRVALNRLAVTNQLQQNHCHQY